MSARTEPPAELSDPGLVLLWGNTPNGWKITCLLQALKEKGAIPDYTAVEVFLQHGEQFQPWFLRANPNSKMPALIDNRPNKPPLHIWDSGSILQYLARAYDENYDYHFEDDDLETEMINWLYWTLSGLGPMQGQVNHFYRYSGEKSEYALKRYTDETYRLYQVLEDHLLGTHDGQKKDWLVGGKPSCADFCAQPWIRTGFWGGLSLAAYPTVSAWVDRVESLPFVQNALKVPVQDLVTRVKSDPELEAKLMAGMKKMKEDKEAKEREEAEKAKAKEEGK
ncbi:hypothetical protein JCM8097_007401 [Rhodosporidiobolus ruineniae]